MKQMGAWEARALFLYLFASVADSKPWELTFAALGLACMIASLVNREP